jgi:hypothetical protein
MPLTKTKIGKCRIYNEYEHSPSHDNFSRKMTLWFLPYKKKTNDNNPENPMAQSVSATKLFCILPPQIASEGINIAGIAKYLNWILIRPVKTSAMITPIHQDKRYWMTEMTKDGKPVSMRNGNINSIITTIELDNKFLLLIINNRGYKQ